MASDAPAALHAELGNAADPPSASAYDEFWGVGAQVELLWKLSGEWL